MNSNANKTLYFYQGNKLINVQCDGQSRSILRAADVPLAELHSDNTPGQANLLAVDVKGTVLNVDSDQESEAHRYSAYGHDPTDAARLALLGFNGERREPATGCYLLGNGYRLYNTVLMRFCSPDSYSPWGDGGTNTYVYCAGDPANYSDPSGHAKILRIISTKTTAKRLERTPLTINENGDFRYEILQEYTVAKENIKLHALAPTQNDKSPILYVPSYKLDEFQSTVNELKLLANGRANHPTMDNQNLKNKISKVELIRNNIFKEGKTIYDKAKAPEDTTYNIIKKQNKPK